MKKMMNKKTLVMLVAAAALISLPLFASAANDKLVVQDSQQNDVFKIGDDGSMDIDGADANNSFSYKIIGHSGGDSHTQTATGLANSRLTVMAGEVDDYAPRLAMTGPQDSATAVQGWMVFDYGSGKYDLPNARFVLRHYGPGGQNDYAYMMQVVGRDSVSFPTGNVGIGTTNPTHLLELAGGAYSDGASWVNASSRELKKDIQDVTVKEAMNTVEKLQPVTFVYKEGNQDTHVGFIAEDVPDMVATPDRKGIEAMDIVAVLTKVVQDQQKTMKELQSKIGELETALQFKQDKDAGLAQK